MEKSQATPPSYEQATGAGTGTDTGTGTEQARPFFGNSARQQYIPQSTYTEQQPVIIVQQTAPLPIGPDASYLKCPYCHVQKLTHVEYEPNTRTHLFAALLCLLGFWCCACVPYCMDSCMSANHYCGNCNQYLGAYRND